MNLANLTSEALALRLLQTLGNERDALVEFLLLLGELDRRGDYERAGYATLWGYGLRHLHLGEGEVFLRTNAAYMLRSYPRAADYLRDGRLSMTTFVLLKAVLTEENAETLFIRASLKSKEEVRYLIASMKAAPADSAPLIRKVSEETTATPRFETPPPGAPINTMSIGAAETEQTVFLVPLPAPVREVVTPLGGERFRIHVTVGSAFIAKLNSAKAIYSHVIRGDDPAAVLERALDAIIELEAKKHGPREGKARASRAGGDRAAGLDPRRGTLHLVTRIGRDLRIDVAARDRSHRAGCPRRKIRSGKSQALLQRP